uniref:Uncharacterized protein n=1 Tax=Auxenochlorella protothecoides TaxID=3075 RepID=A0A1D2A1S4_AUXPR
MLGLGITIGAGVWQLTGLAATTLAGPSIIIAYLLAGTSCTAAAACYGELAVEYPVAGGSFTYIMLTFGEFPAWIAVSNQMGIEVFGSAALARSFSAFLASMCGQPPTFFTLSGSHGDEDDWSIDLMAGGVTLLITLVLTLSGRLSGIFITGVTLVKLGLILFILVVAFTKADPSNLHPFFRDGDVGGMLSAASIFVYTMTGFDSISNAAEEAKNIDSLPWAMTGVTITATVLYTLLALALSMLLPATAISASDGMGHDFLTIGLHYMKYVVAVAAVLGSFTGLLVGLYTASRIAMVVARDWMLPPWLAKISTRTNTPARAQIVVGVVVALIAAFSSGHFLADLVSFGQLLSIWFVVNAQLYRRYYPGVKLRFTRHGTVETNTAPSHAWVPGSRLDLSLVTRQILTGVHMVLITLGATGLATWFRTTTGSDRTLRVAGCSAFFLLYFLAALSMRLLCPLQYEPQRWHVPAFLMPWLPATAIGMVLFGMTSLQSSIWIKVGAYNAIGLIFYLLFSLPMSYIKHYKLDFTNTELLNVVDMQFVDGKWEAAASNIDRVGTAVTTLSLADSSDPQRSLKVYGYPGASGSLASNTPVRSTRLSGGAAYARSSLSGRGTTPASTPPASVMNGQAHPAADS